MGAPQIAAAAALGQVAADDVVPALVGAAAAIVLVGAAWWWRGRRGGDRAVPAGGAAPAGRCRGGGAIEHVQEASASLAPYEIAGVRYVAGDRWDGALPFVEEALRSLCAAPPRRAGDLAAAVEAVAAAIVDDAPVPGAGVQVIVELAGAAVPVVVQRYRCARRRWKKDGAARAETRPHRIAVSLAHLAPGATGLEAERALRAGLRAFVDRYG